MSALAAARPALVRWRGHASLAAALTALALLGGCISVGGKAPALLVALSAEKSAPAGAMPGGAITDALVVLDPETDRKLDMLRIPVQVDDAKIAYLKDAAWVERPARQFRHLLAETIRARGARLVIEAGDLTTGGKTTLSGRLIDMGYDARSQSVVVRYDAMRDIGGTIEARRFEAVVPGIGSSAEAIAPALNRAANQVAAQVADWVG
jgi:cholesterol transport system auxiliary component